MTTGDIAPDAFDASARNDPALALRAPIADRQSIAIDLTALDGALAETLRRRALA